MDKPIYPITTDASEIIAKTQNRVSPIFTEAAKVVEGDNIQRSLAYLKSFADSIDTVAKERGRDKTIIASSGNIATVKNYDTMVKAMEHLGSFLGANSELAALKAIHEALIKYQPIYADGYKLGVPLVIHEYEAASGTLIRGISSLIVTQTDPQLDGIGKIRFNKARRQTGGVFTKVAKDMARELKAQSHEKYLKQMIEIVSDPDLKVAPEQVITESVGVAMSVAKTVVDVLRYGYSGAKTAYRFGKLVIRSMFGIIPLIRSCIYLHYKKKADTIASLEMQAQYVQMNIEQLENIKTMDPEKKKEIIKKQQAYITAYRKKAEKLRVELMDSERAGAQALAEDDANIKPSDDYVLD